MDEHEGARIYVLVDALGWEVLRDRSFLEDILTHRYRVETILGYSCGAIPTLLTGQLPNGHGHWNNFYRSPQSSPFRWTRPLRWLPERVREWRGTRRGIAEITKRLFGYRGYFAIHNMPVDRLAHYAVCETDDIYAPGGLAPASSLFDILTARGVPYECYNYHTHTDDQILDLVPQRLASSASRVYFLYLCGLDAYLHYNIDDAKGVDEQLRLYDRGLRRIFRAAERRWGRANMSVFSDHGMTPVRRTVDLISEVEGLGLRVPSDYLPAYDSTMARFWLESRLAEERLSGLLEKLPYGRVLAEEEKDRLGLSFEDHRYGQIVFLMEPGTLICPSDMGRTPVAGMHGFHPQEEPSSYAVFLSSMQPVPPVRHIVDVLPAILADLE